MICKNGRREIGLVSSMRDVEDRGLVDKSINSTPFGANVWATAFDALIKPRTSASKSQE